MTDITPDLTPQTTTPENRKTIEEILGLMQLSSMNDEERTMWTVLLPSMETAELEKFRDILAREIQKMTDIYLRAKKES